MRSLNFFTLLFISSICWSHARLINPVPRNNNAGIKIGPCGGLARSATPTVVQGGSTMAVQWEETINHPGRFIISLSMANDQNFNQNVLATILDNQNGGAPLPYRFQAQITIPNINCPTCTIQLIQSMEENPAAPTYYYSCADINIQMVAAPEPPPAPTPTPEPTPTPPPTPPPSEGGGNEGVQNSVVTQQAEGVKFGKGCGTVKSVTASPTSTNWMFAYLLMMLIPVLTWTGLRRASLFSIVDGP